MLSGKTKFVYLKMLYILKQKEIRIESVIIDNERAVIDALNSVFPCVFNHLCFFHFNKNIYKNIQTMGLAVDYYEELMFRYQMKRFICMTFLENDLIPIFF